MGSFLTWSEWIGLREDNARKRAVRAALAGTGVKLVGSSAACPSTNPRAMKSAIKNKGVVGPLGIDENDDQMPNYSFDGFIQKARQLNTDVGKLRTGFEKEDKDIDKKKKEAEKKAQEEDKKRDKEEKDKEKESKEKEGSESEPKEEKGRDDTWKKLRAIHDKAIKKLQGGDSHSEDFSEN